MPRDGAMADDGSLPDPAPPAPTDPRLPLNARQVFKLKKSWKGIKRNMEATGLEMFVRMFKKHEDAKQLFKNFRNLKTEDELRMSEALEKHGGKVMAVIDETISNIENVDCILGVLNTAGIMHGRFGGFSPNMFWRIEEPFLEAVKLTLSDRYTDNMDAIYRLLIKFILETMINALKDDISNGPNNV